MKYEGRKTAQISFPLGGIGTGCIGLMGNGSFGDIEIGNAPNKDSGGNFLHFAIKAEDRTGVLDARVINGDLQPPMIGHVDRPIYTGYGFGPDRGSMAGMPHFEKSDFDGEFPLAKLRFRDAHFPGQVQMTAFNPLIPTNTFDSSLPAALFLIRVRNDTEQSLRYTVAMTTRNWYSQRNSVQRFEKHDGMQGLTLSNTADPAAMAYGDVTIATDAPEISYQEYWYRGLWFDGLTSFWNDFTTPGKLQNRSYAEQGSYCGADFATLAAHVQLEPGETAELRFVFTWNKPWISNTWLLSNPSLTEEEISQVRNARWKNYYATKFEDSRASARYILREFDRLYRETCLFHDAIYQSSMPAEALDAVTANLAVLKSPTCLRLEDGSFYAFEGVHRSMGSCEGTCTHVWSYAYALAYLFPELERSARTLEYTCSMQPNGGMGFRLQIPVGRRPTTFRPCVDGQFGCVIRVYREYMLSGDRQWLKKIWPQVKRSVEFAWSDQNPDHWDRNRDGVMEGRQHHTLDMELFGENSWLTGMYLTGLQAAIRLADAMNDLQAAAQYTQIYESGRKKLNETLFNGEYFFQKVDLKDSSLLTPYTAKDSLQGQSAMDGYWNRETGEMKYQIGEGCSIDQVLGQWHADLLGLGRTFDEEKTRSALRSIFRYNYIPVLREHVNPCRIYGLNDESGTMICSYPPHARKPAIPVPYAEETMHGFEYEAASHMLLYGMEEEGLACAGAVRRRYDGERRNPWNEMECGSNYARSLSSYALLLAYSGFICNAPEAELRFSPLKQRNGSWFFSMDSGFGTITYSDAAVKLQVLYGFVLLRKLLVGRAAGGVSLNGTPIPAQCTEAGIVLETARKLLAGDCLDLRLA